MTPKALTRRHPRVRISTESNSSSTTRRSRRLRSWRRTHCTTCLTSKRSSELITRRLDPGGVLVVAEWARERFDEGTARWCFDRLADDEPGWLHRRRDEWLDSGQSWDAYLDRHAHAEGMHTGQDVLRALGARFDTRLIAECPYFFPDLEGVTAADEQAAIDAGHIQANRHQIRRPWDTPGIEPIQAGPDHNRHGLWGYRQRMSGPSPLRAMTRSAPPK